MIASYRPDLIGKTPEEIQVIILGEYPLQAGWCFNYSTKIIEILFAEDVVSGP